MTSLPQPGYQSPTPYDQDQSHLNTLSIFYFIFAGLQALGALIGLIYMAIGLIVGAVGMASGRADDAGAAAIFGGFFVCIGLFIILIAGVFAFLDYKAGRSLRARTSITLCYVMAAIHCVNVPFGTILGVFTFIVLGRPSVKSTFT